MNQKLENALLALANKMESLGYDVATIATILDWVQKGSLAGGQLLQTVRAEYENVKTAAEAHRKMLTAVAMLPMMERQLIAALKAAFLEAAEEFAIEASRYNLAAEILRSGKSSSPAFDEASKLASQLREYWLQAHAAEAGEAFGDNAGAILTSIWTCSGPPLAIQESADVVFINMTGDFEALRRRICEAAAS